MASQALRMPCSASTASGRPVLARPIRSSPVTTRRAGVVPTFVTRAAETEAVASEAAAVVEAEADFFAEDKDERGFRPRRDSSQEKLEFKHFLPLPKPAHLVYIKPTVAVVAGMASRSSVGLKMTAGDNQLERYIIEFYSRKI